MTKISESAKILWKESGNSIAHLYAGTGALESGSAIEDAKRSISRTIKNNTSDSKKTFEGKIRIKIFRGQAADN